jgi:hypothetical protein
MMHAMGKSRKNVIMGLMVIIGSSIAAMTVTTRRAIARTSITMITPPPPTPMPDGSPPRFVRHANSAGASAIASKVTKPTPALTPMVIPFKAIRVIVVMSVLFLAGYFADLATVKKEWLTLGSKMALFTSALSRNTRATWAATITATTATMKVATIKMATMNWPWYYAVGPAVLGMFVMIYTSKMFAPKPSSPRVRSTLNSASTTDNTSVNVNTKVSNNANVNSNTNANANANFSENNLGSGGKPYTVISAPPSSSAAAFVQTPAQTQSQSQARAQAQAQAQAQARPLPTTPRPTTSSSTISNTNSGTHSGASSSAQPYKIVSAPKYPVATAQTLQISSQFSSTTPTTPSASSVSYAPVTPSITPPVTPPVTPTGTSSMGASTRVTDAADVLFNDLVDVKKVFEKIDSELVADLISPRLYPIVDQVMVKDVRAVRTAKGIPALPVVYEVVLRARTQVLVRKVIDRVKEDPTQFIDFKSLIASEVAVHDQLIKLLTKRSRRFAVVSGVTLALVASVIQLFGWLALDPRWSLTVAGVGLLAEAMFLERQEEVMTELAELITSKLLSPQRLWKELTHGPKSSALVAVITQELRAEFSLFLYNTATAGNYREFAAKIREALPDAATPSYRHLETVLNVKGYMRTALRRIGSGITQLYGI